MPLALLVPAALAALAAVVVPILVHLRHRERKEPIRFPSLMFLRRIPFRQVRRQQIHHWPLFLIRLGVIVLVSLAFARPFLSGASTTVAGADTRSREMVILLDRSASMGFGNRWAGAVDSVRGVLAGLAGNDRATLVVFDAEPVALTRPTRDRALLEAALDASGPGSGVTRYAPALRVARDLIAGTDLPRREVILVSDFQRTGWQGEAIEPLPEGTEFRKVNAGSATAPNRSVISAELTPADAASRPGLLVTARIATTGIASPSARAVLTIDGREAAAADVVLEDGLGSARLGPVALPDVRGRGIVRLAPPDSLAVDDAFQFVATRERPVNVVRVAGASGAAFLDRALAISRTPRMQVVERQNRINAADLGTADVVVLHDAPFPSGGAARALEVFVREGGGLVVFLGEERGAWPAWLGLARPGPTVERTESPGAVASVSRDHPVFGPFQAARSGDFSSARLFRYRRLDGDSLRVLARLDDGSAALAEISVGRGRVLIWTSAMDNVWSDLPLQPVFLPLMHQLVLYAARHVSRPAALTVGRIAALGREELGSAGEVVIVSPSGVRSRMTVGEAPVAVPVIEAGFYEVREAGVAGRVLTLLAANVDPEETRLAAMDPADLDVAVGAVDSGVVRSRPVALSPAEQEGRQGLWWFALGAVALLLAAEPLIGNRIAGYVRGAPSPGAGG
jgi:hypothetical protein